jgi:tRNA (guanine6-N2)-methyltransferase
LPERPFGCYAQTVPVPFFELSRKRLVIMARRDEALPSCYAMVQPGLEDIAAAEIAAKLDGEVKRTGKGIVVFRVPEIDEGLFRLRTTDDVFLLAWGTDELSYRAEDLDRIRRWTANADWQRLLRLHHALRPKPKGKPTFRLVTQMVGEHGYRRADAGKALGKGLDGKLPASWRFADENAAVEIWLTIHGATGVCGLRLSDKTMRHRTYKREHLPASLRPTVAAAMVQLLDLKPRQTLLDPMCGAGTILAEQLALGRHEQGAKVRTLGGDLDLAALRIAEVNLRPVGRAHLVRWDATQLPLADACVDAIASNPPFGVQLGEPEEMAPLYRRAVREYDRVLRPGGKAVLLVADHAALREAARNASWKPLRTLQVRVLGQRATMSLWRKATT